MHQAPELDTEPTRGPPPSLEAARAAAAEAFAQQDAEKARERVEREAATEAAEKAVREAERQRIARSAAQHRPITEGGDWVATLIRGTTYRIQVAPARWRVFHKGVPEHIDDALKAKLEVQATDKTNDLTQVTLPDGGAVDRPYSREVPKFTYRPVGEVPA